VEINDKYTVRSLYEVIKNSLLLKNKELKSFIITMNDEILSEFKKVKTPPTKDLNYIIRNCDNYYHVYILIQKILIESNISTHNENARKICDFFLEDELDKRQNKSNIY